MGRADSGSPLYQITRLARCTITPAIMVRTTITMDMLPSSSQTTITTAFQPHSLAQVTLAAYSGKATDHTASMSPERLSPKHPVSILSVNVTETVSSYLHFYSSQRKQTIFQTRMSGY